VHCYSNRSNVTWVTLYTLTVQSVEPEATVSPLVAKHTTGPECACDAPSVLLLPLLRSTLQCSSMSVYGVRQHTKSESVNCGGDDSERVENQKKVRALVVEIKVMNKQVFAVANGDILSKYV
jgi:hypothetical protein